MGNKCSKWCNNTRRSCKNVTCFDNCSCLRCFKRSPKKLDGIRSLTLETVSMPYIDEAGKC